MAEMSKNPELETKFKKQIFREKFMVMSPIDFSFNDEAIIYDSSEALKHYRASMVPYVSFLGLSSLSYYSYHGIFAYSHPAVTVISFIMSFLMIPSLL